MTFLELEEKLRDTWLFLPNEISHIMRLCEKATLGNAIIACHLLGLELSGNDVDIIIREGA